jgi:hypothetical protein
VEESSAARDSLSVCGCQDLTAAEGFKPAGRVLAMRAAISTIIAEIVCEISPFR